MISPINQILHFVEENSKNKKLLHNIKQIVQDVRFLSNSMRYVEAIGKIDKMLKDE